MQHLDACHNKLVDIPQQYCYIRTLRRLNLSDNEITGFYGPIHFWINLQALDVSNNKLMVLPLEFSQLPLLDLHMHGNPDLKVPQKALEGGTTSLLCYLGTIGAQHRMMTDYIDSLTFSNSDKSKDNQDEEGEIMGRIIAAEQVGQSGEDGGGGGALVASTSEDRSVIYEQVRQTREWLESDPRRARLAMTMKQKQKAMRKEVEQTRKFLATKNMEVGNPHILLMDRARYTGILNLKSTSLNSIPPEVKDLKDLKVADLRMNNLTSLDEHILDNQTLTVLDASHNHIAHMTSGINLPSLKVLCLAFNNLKQIGAEVPRMVRAVTRTSFTHSLSLSLSRVIICGLLTRSYSLFFSIMTPHPRNTKAREVEVVYLSGNYLSTLPDTFAELGARDVYISENSFATVPAPVLEMTQITKLSLSCNQITFVPPQIADLVNLQFLDISFNNIQELPRQFGDLPNLERLNAGFNPLGPEVPVCLTKLPKLVEVSQLCSLPLSPSLSLSPFPPSLSLSIKGPAPSVCCISLTLMNPPPAPLCLMRTAQPGFLGHSNPALGVW